MGNISLTKSSIKEKGGVVVIPLKKWGEIESDLEDLEMYRSKDLANEIKERRADKENIPLDQLLEKHSL